MSLHNSAPADGIIYGWMQPDVVPCPVSRISFQFSVSRQGHTPQETAKDHIVWIGLMASLVRTDRLMLPSHTPIFTTLLECKLTCRVLIKVLRDVKYHALAQCDWMFPSGVLLSGYVDMFP